VHFLWFQITVEQLNVSTTAIDILFMFDCVLDDEVFAFITEWREFFGQCIKPSVLRRLYTFVSLGIIVESARAVYEFTKLFSGMFRVSPFALKRIYGTIISNIKLTGFSQTIVIIRIIRTIGEVLFKVDLRTDG
jgi:hypothetical protein